MNRKGSEREQLDKKLFSIRLNTEEILTVEDLRKLIFSGTKLRHYIGFEISGRVHLGQGLMCMGKVADFLKAGVECNLFLADWHTYINEKLGGEWKNIQKVALGYFKEALIAGLKCFGVRSGEVNFILASKVYKDLRHWKNFVEVSRHTTLSRVKRALDIAGREAKEGVDFAKLIYPPLQVADIFTLGVNIAHAGIDQRKAHVIARRVALQLKTTPLKDKNGQIIKPVAVHHPILLGLQKPPVWPLKKIDRKVKIMMKMSKSKPDSAIWIHDSPQEIRRKVAKAFCPPDNVDLNPIVNWVKYLVFWGGDKGEFEVRRPRRFGGNKTYYDYHELVHEYREGALHSQDLKNAFADWLIAKLEPVRKHFRNEKRAEALMFLEKLIS